MNPLPRDYPGLSALMAARHSTRRYRPNPLPEELWAGIVAEAGRPEPWDAARRVTLHPVPLGETVTERLRGLVGAYGRIVNAPHYLAMLAPEGPEELFETGWRVERLVLSLTARGVGSCWVGGLYDEGELRRLFPEPPELKLITLLALGFPAEDGWGGFLNRRIHRAVPHGGERLPLEEILRRDNWEGPAAADSPFAPAVEAARLAPSWANLQPWRFIQSGDGLFLCVGPTRRGRRTPNIAHGRDYWRLDGGIAALHFSLAAGALGLAGRWAAVEDERESAVRLHLPEGVIPQRRWIV